MTGYVQSLGFKEVWDDIGPGFSEDFTHWLDRQLASLPSQPGKAGRPGAA